MLSTLFSHSFLIENNHYSIVCFVVVQGRWYEVEESDKVRDVQRQIKQRELITYLSKMIRK